MPVRALSVRAGEKLIGSRDGLFYVDELRNRFAEFKTPALRSSMIFSIEPYGGEYYVGTYGGGMYIFNPERMELRDFESTTVIPFVNGHIFCMEQDAHGELWIGTSAGLFRYRGGKRVAHYTSANSQLPEGNVYEIFFDSTRKGWICTENGLCCGILLPRNSVRMYSPKALFIARRFGWFTKTKLISFFSFPIRESLSFPTLR